jgi:hypothetical protein
MDMKRLRNQLCNELDAIDIGKMTADKISLIDMLTHSIKSIDTITAMQREGYSNSYMRDNNDNNSYNSYNEPDMNRNRDRYDRSYNDGYSRNDMNEEIRSRLAKMLDRANNDSDRDAIRRTMNMM